MHHGKSLGVTFEEIRASIDEHLEIYNQNPYSPNQTFTELDILENIWRSRPPQADFLSHLDDKVVDLLSEMVDREFYNENVLYFMSDVLYAIYYSKDKELTVSKIRTWLRHLTRLSSGFNGITLTSALGNLLRNDIVVKYPKIGDLTHEVFVGLLGTNKLRKYIPNFSFVYGGFACSPPIIGTDGKVKDFCAYLTQRKPLNYALYENIAPAVSGENLIIQSSGEEFLNFYLQLILALHVAYERISFTHFDLHDKNVLARQLSGPVNILYLVQGKEYHIKTSYVATVIDYGISSFEYQGMHFGNLGDLVSYIGNAREFPLFDAFTFLTSAFATAHKAGNSSVLSMIKRILPFFTDEDPEVLMENLGEWSLLPSRLMGVDLLSLIDFLVLFKPSALNIAGQSISCSEIDCRDAQDVLQEINFAPIKTPDDVEQLWVNIASVRDPEELNRYIDSISPELFFFFEAFEQDLAALERKIKYISSLDEMLGNIALCLRILDKASMFESLSDIFPSISKVRLDRAKETISSSLSKLQEDSEKWSNILKSKRSDLDTRDKLSYIAYFQALE